MTMKKKESSAFALAESSALTSPTTSSADAGGVTYYRADHSDFPDDDDDDANEQTFAASTGSVDDYTPTEHRSKSAEQEPSNDSKQQPRAQVEQYSTQETKDVWTWKTLVIMLLVVAGGFSVAACAAFVRQTQEDEFETAHANAANELAHGLQEHYATLVQNMETQAQWIVAQAQVQEPTGLNVVWSNVTLPTFDFMAQSLTTMSGVAFVAWAPLVVVDSNNNQGLGSLLAAPIRQIAPADGKKLIGYDVLGNNQTRGLFEAVTTSNETLLTALPQQSQDDSAFGPPPPPPKAAIMSQISDSSRAVGLVVAELEWRHVLHGHLSSNNDNQDTPDDELHVVLRSSCGDAMDTFLVTASRVEYLGSGDLHHAEFDAQDVFVPFYQFQDESTTPFVPGHCFFSMHVFPTVHLQNEYQDNLVLQVTVAVTALFVAVTAAFMVYDYFVSKRQTKIVTAAARSHAIVASVFPAAVRERLMEESSLHAPSGHGTTNKGRLKNLMHHGLELDANEGNIINSKPIADLFPESTIFFADISGCVFVHVSSAVFVLVQLRSHSSSILLFFRHTYRFTAWSSTREPSQVFILLETIFARFDSVAKKRRIFKVETVGDCYVAATGLPDPRPEHAVAMARFARDCLRCMREAVNQLELTLGPDTADLQLRIGIHSGPITAGYVQLWAVASLAQ